MFIYPDKSEYKGHFQNGLKHGFGIFKKDN